jgi:hypothetical protein
MAFVIGIKTLDHSGNPGDPACDRHQASQRLLNARLTHPFVILNIRCNLHSRVAATSKHNHAVQHSIIP